MAKKAKSDSENKNPNPAASNDTAEVTNAPKGKKPKKTY